MPTMPWKVTTVIPISDAVKLCVAVMLAFAALLMAVIVRFVLRLVVYGACWGRNRSTSGVW